MEESSTKEWRRGRPSPSFHHGFAATCQAPLSMEFSRQEYWSCLPFPSPGDLPNPGIKPGSPALQADALLSELSRKPSRMREEGDSMMGGDYELVFLVYNGELK